MLILSLPLFIIATTDRMLICWDADIHMGKMRRTVADVIFNFSYCTS